MSRLMSVAMTTDAVIERRKTVTRRKGWWLDKNGRRLLNVGDTLILCRKVQGRKPGEPIERLAEVEVVSVRREPLDLLENDYGWEEVAREGFPEMPPWVFVSRFFVDAQGMHPHAQVTRVEWRYLDPACHCGDSITPANESPLVGTCDTCLAQCLCDPCREARWVIEEDRRDDVARMAWREGSA